MWGRAVEVMLGLWLVLSPFIFRHFEDGGWLWVNDMVCGGAVVVVALAAMLALLWWPRLRYVHLAILVVGAWLAGFGYVAGGHPSEGGYQNEILVGLTLMFIALIPTEANVPPVSWRRFYEQREREAGRGG